jgi:hypothetical protein
MAHPYITAPRETRQNGEFHMPMASSIHGARVPTQRSSAQYRGLPARIQQRFVLHLKLFRLRALGNMIYELVLPVAAWLVINPKLNPINRRFIKTRSDRIQSINPWNYSNLINKIQVYQIEHVPNAPILRVIIRARDVFITYCTTPPPYYTSFGTSNTPFSSLGSQSIWIVPD